MEKKKKSKTTKQILNLVWCKWKTVYYAKLPEHTSLKSLIPDLLDQDHYFLQLMLWLSNSFYSSQLPLRMNTQIPMATGTDENLKKIINYIYQNQGEQKYISLQAAL